MRSRYRLPVMKYLIIIALILPIEFFGQIRYEDQTIDDFAIAYAPENSILIYKPFEVKWENSEGIVAFYEQPYTLRTESYKRIIAMMFESKFKKHYQTYIIDTIFNEGGAPKIKTAFVVNADNDKEVELAIIVMWPQQNKIVNGNLFGTFLYDFNTSKKYRKFKLLEKLSDKLSGDCECTWDDGTEKISKYKTEEDIKIGLRNLGY